MVVLWINKNDLSGGKCSGYWGKASFSYIQDGRHRYIRNANFLTNYTTNLCDTSFMTIPGVSNPFLGLFYIYQIKLIPD